MGMATLCAVLFALALLVATCLIHYETLRVTADLVPRLDVPARAGILIVMTGVFVAHFLEVALYAAALASMQQLGLGAVGGQREGGALDFIYLSLSSYTTLGVGDVVPTGPMRIVTSVEALNGFVLIGWSAAFTFPVMERFWAQHNKRGEGAARPRSRRSR
jgi:hypothetical protein